MDARNKADRPSLNDVDTDEWMFPKRRNRPVTSAGDLGPARVGLHGSINVKTHDPRWSDTDRWSASIFVTNFPPDASRKVIWDKCSSVALVVDVFISNRLSAKGKRFAFVRFSKEVDVVAVIPKIRDLWIGSYRLFADAARFKRQVSGKSQFTPAAPVSSVGGVPVPGRVSYAQVTKGNWVEAVDKIPEEVGIIFDDALVPAEDLANSLLLKVRDISVIGKLYIHAHNEGFSNVEFCYLGGLWVRVDCVSEDDCKKFAACETFASLFAEIRQVSEEFCIDEKLVWIEIRGLPLLAWSNAVFRQIAWRWGKTFCVDNDRDEPMAFGRVCILSRHIDKIRDSVWYRIKDKKYKVTVTELHAWSPTFEHVSDEDSDSEVDSEEELNDIGSGRDDNFQQNEEEVDVHVPPAVTVNLEEGTGAVGGADSDPFNLGPIIRGEIEKTDCHESSPSRPPGFSNVGFHSMVEKDDGLISSRPGQVNDGNVVKEGGDNGDVKSRGSACKSSLPQNVSLLDEFHKLIERGLAFGVDMEGSKRDLVNLINRMSDSPVSR
ncbi:hypothetical protein SSX86_006186 [Deinandra increscens subsp. villosa]|uniref:RRM domain-containing protein n=1 Tax=Deinandra increscens subsp. villosa TaxID=3103831 RepID=A0AAP0H7J2_9ASTR